MKFWIENRRLFPTYFRVLLGSLLLLDAGMVVSVGEFLYDSKTNYFVQGSSLISFARDNYIGVYIIYMITLFFFIVGIGKNVTVFLVFALGVFINQMEPGIATWGDLITNYTLLFFVFVNSFQRFSYSFIFKNFSMPVYLSKLGVLSIILNLFLVYFSNGFAKIQDPAWQDGYAIYFAFSQYENFEGSIFHYFLSNKWICIFMTYFIIFFQLIFPFLILWKKSRYVTMVMGILMHLLMIAAFGLWKFELTMILLYGFLLNDTEWTKLLPKYFLVNDNSNQ